MIPSRLRILGEALREKRWEGKETRGVELALVRGVGQKEKKGGRGRSSKLEGVKQGDRA